MIYTEDSISELTRNAIRISNKDVIIKKEKQKLVMNIVMWSTVFIMIIVASSLAIIGMDVGWIWGWPVLLMIMTVITNRQYDYEIDVMKISVNSDIIDSIKSAAPNKAKCG